MCSVNFQGEISPMPDVSIGHDVLFKLRYPNGDWVVIYTDGMVLGVPPGTAIINFYPARLDSLLAQLASEYPEEGN
jgi:hypothetical protein